MYNHYELLILAAILCFAGGFFCLIGLFVEKYLDNTDKHTPINLNPKKMAEYNETVDRR